MPVAVDKRVITGKSPSDSLPALHPQWKEDIRFVQYHPPPQEFKDTAQKEEWLDRLNFLEDDLHYLLKLPYHKFWCQAIFDETLHKCLESYLRYCPRSYDYRIHLKDQCKSKHDKIHRLIFMVCLRMATYKESKENYMTPLVFGEILYENFLFDIPKLMDLCVLYGRANKALLTKMIDNIFTQQPKYENDLVTSISTLIQVFANIQEQCGIKTTTGSSSPQKLSSENRRQLQGMSDQQLDDIIYYMLDICETLDAFLHIYSPACSVFFDGQIHTQLAFFYSSMIPALKEAMVRDYQDWSMDLELKKSLKRSRQLILNIVHDIVFQTCLQPVLDNCTSPAVAQHFENYLQFWSSILTEKRFVMDYTENYCLDEDLEIIHQTSDIDEERIAFIKESIAAHLTERTDMKPKRRPSPSDVVNGFNGISLEDAMDDFQPGPAATADSSDNFELLGACAPSIDRVELESLIVSVKDLLPDLGNGFVELCLEEFDYDLEKTLNAILEDNLPSSVRDLDRNLPSKPLAQESVLSQRANVYDGDEFDVFTRDRVDVSKIHVGKKEKYVEKSILDDKEDISTLRPLYDNYGTVYDEVYVDDKTGMIDLYDDEYDDTYDDNTRAGDADSADELTSRRPFQIPRILGSRRSDSESPERYDNDKPNNEETAPAKRREDFCVDPAILRERREQHYASQRGRGRGGPRGRGDVRGRAKGQGQEKNVTQSRSNKEKNKAARGNHNRRRGSDWKRGRGMIPS